MTLRCCICGRCLKQAAVMIGSMPVGPTCGRRAGLMPLAARRTGLVRPGPAYRRSATRQENDQLDIFDESACVVSNDGA